MHELKKIATVDGIDYFQYNPSFFHLYYSCYPDSDRAPYEKRIIHKIRMMRERFCAHYIVIYMRIKNTFIGHLVVSRGGTRVAESSKNDIVIGPVWVIESQRNKGVGTKGIKTILNDLGIEYRYAFEFIDVNNYSSIKTVEKNGFYKFCMCNEFGIFRTLKEHKDGKYLLYRYENER